MTGFLAFDASGMYAALNGAHVAVLHVDAPRPVAWLYRRYGQPVRRWRIGTKVPELPPG